MLTLELRVGSVAPQLPPLTFLKGEPIHTLEPGQVYVVECWATWCGPCLEVFPHLTRLQNNYPHVKFLGAAVWEDNLESVRQFVAEKDAEMGYTVAFDAREQDQTQSPLIRDWLTPSYQDGIPTAFIVDATGRIAYIGHPMGMDEVLDSLNHSNFDIEAAAEQYHAWLRNSMIAEKSVLQKSVAICLTSNDVAGALETFDAAFANNASLEYEVGTQKLGLLLKHNDPAALTYAKSLVVRHPDLSHGAGVEIIEALESGATVANRTDLIEFSVTQLQQATIDAQAQGAYSLCIASRNLSQALLFAERVSEALTAAQQSLDAGQQADLPEEIIAMLQALVDRCNTRQTMGLQNPKGEVVCEGGVCRIT